MLNHKVAGQMLAQVKGMLSALQEEMEMQAQNKSVYIVQAGDMQDGITFPLCAFPNENLARRYIDFAQERNSLLSYEVKRVPLCYQDEDFS